VTDTRISKRSFLRAAAAAAIVPGVSEASQTISAPPVQPPNVVLIYADDLGFGDLGCYGSSIQTPNLDRLAQEGVRFTQLNSASPVCSPARASLLTGRYSTRLGVSDVLFPKDYLGLDPSETTIAAMLKRKGYRTMCVGKWHLGSMPQFLPTNRGFDEFFGLLYSTDMPPLQLMHDTNVIESNCDISTLTQRYTEQALKFLANSDGSQFFLYLAYSSPHIPLIASKEFQGRSSSGPYGDVVEEIDWSVGQVLDTLEAYGLEDNTLVLFSSDHGPWYQGSAGILRGGKGETFEGGVRVPFNARYPGRIPRGQVSRSPVSIMDVFPTVARLCGAPLPAKHLDGVDVWQIFTGEAREADRDILLYFDGWHLQCARSGRWKLHVARYNSVVWGPAPPGGRINLPLPAPELYDLESDPRESYDVADDNPKVVEEMLSRIKDLLPTFPGQVTSAWRYTQSLKVENTPSGALPVLKTP